MPDSELNEQLEFEERIKAMPTDDRSIFTAKQIYMLSNKIDVLNTKLDNFSGTGTSKKTVATTSGITTAIVIGIIEGLKGILGK